MIKSLISDLLTLPSIIVTFFKLQQINERYDSTILGCPAVFSKVNIKYKYGQLLKDIFYWQMDLYKEILLIID